MSSARERPILFSGPMVRAILDGRKSQTRRVLKCQPEFSYRSPPFGNKAKVGDLFVCQDYFPTEPGPPNYVIAENTGLGGWHMMGQKCFAEKHCPYGKPGDRLWVRETWATHWANDDLSPSAITAGQWSIRYLADDYSRPADDGSRADLGQCKKVRPSIFMPRWASRITLEITGVRVERVQEISEADAIAEGCVAEDITQEWVDDCSPGTPERELAEMMKGGSMTAKWAYFNLWGHIHGKTHPWASNPWVWVLEFKRL